MGVGAGVRTRFPGLGTLPARLSVYSTNVTVRFFEQLRYLIFAQQHFEQLKPEVRA